MAEALIHGMIHELRQEVQKANEALERIVYLARHIQLLRSEIKDENDQHRLADPELDPALRSED